MSFIVGGSGDGKKGVTGAGPGRARRLAPAEQQARSRNIISGAYEHGQERGHAKSRAPEPETIQRTRPGYNIVSVATPEESQKAQMPSRRRDVPEEVLHPRAPQHGKRRSALEIEEKRAREEAANAPKEPFPQRPGQQRQQQQQQQQQIPSVAAGAASVPQGSGGDFRAVNPRGFDHTGTNILTGKAEGPVAGHATVHKGGFRSEMYQKSGAAAGIDPLTGRKLATRVAGAKSSKAGGIFSRMALHQGGPHLVCPKCGKVIYVGAENIVRGAYVEGQAIFNTGVQHTNCFYHPKGTNERPGRRNDFISYECCFAPKSSSGCQLKP